MRLKREIGLAKLQSIITEHAGTTFLAAHLIPGQMYYLSTILDAGFRMLELTHAHTYLQQNPPSKRVYEGGIYDSHWHNHTVSMEEMARHVSTVRRFAGQDVFIHVAAAGLLTQPVPVNFTANEARILSSAGADGLHVHLSNLEELSELTEIAHEQGLLVEAYIHQFTSATDMFSYFGISADTPDQIKSVVQKMETIGVDIIGLMWSRDPKYYSYQGATDKLPSDLAERFKTLVEIARVPTSAEGQITPTIAAELRRMGVKVVVLGRVFDLAIEDAITNVAKRFGMPAGAMRQHARAQAE
jgi:hypothetical protein